MARDLGLVASGNRVRPRVLSRAWVRAWSLGFRVQGVGAGYLNPKPYIPKTQSKLASQGPWLVCSKVKFRLYISVAG